MDFLSKDLFVISNDRKWPVKTVYEKIQSLEEQLKNYSIIGVDVEQLTKIESFAIFLLCLKSAKTFVPLDANSLTAYTKFLKIDVLISNDPFPKVEILQSCSKTSKTIRELTSDVEYQSSFNYAMKTSSTSGSHDRLVLTNISSIESNIKHLLRLFDIKNRPEIISQLTPFTFDPVMVELFLFLHCPQNSCLLLIEQDKIFKQNLPRLLENNRVSIIPQITPSLYTIAPSRKTTFLTNRHLKHLVFGGESFIPENTFPQDLITKYYGKTSLTIWNMYGLTELSCWTSAKKLDLEDLTSKRSLSIGKTFPDTEIKIENEILLVKSERRKNIILDYAEGKFPNINQGVLNILTTDNWVDTQDSVEKINDEIFLNGRADDTRKVFSKRVNLIKIERKLTEIFDDTADF